MRVAWVARSLAHRILLILSIASCEVVAVERIKIEDQRDPKYLPYTLESIWSNRWDASRPWLKNGMQVYKAKRGESDTGIIVNIANAVRGTDMSAQVSMDHYPQLKVLSDKPIWLTVTDYICSYDSTLQETCILGGGYRRDSAFVFKYVPSSGIVTYQYLCCGIDRTGNGRWEPFITVITGKDYDFDGRSEIFVYVDAGRDLQPRVLCCLEVEPFSIQWSLPVAGKPTEDLILDCGDSLDPGILFVAGSPNNGAADSVFDDTYSYLVRLSAKGEIVLRKTLGRSTQVTSIVARPQDSICYLQHFLPLDTAVKIDDSVNLPQRLSVVTKHGRVIRSITCPDGVGQIEYGDSLPGGLTGLYTWSYNGIVRIYDSGLSLLAESKATNLVVGSHRLSALADQRNLIICPQSQRRVVFTADFRMAAEFPGEWNSATPLDIDSSGDVRALVINFRNGGEIVRVSKKSFLELANIFYLDYQVYVLSTLISLAIGLMVVNLYRGRATRQKRELEATHKELAKLHEELKQAQQIIVAQEKYRQAKDIAGGFAHEIRNALFPADSAITVLHEKAESGPVPKETIERFLGNVHSSIARAVRITNLITQYTRLDAQHGPERVDLAHAVAEAVKENQPHIDRLKVQTVLRGPGDLFIEGNRVQLASVLTNLLLNALEALTNRTNPTILMEWQATGDRITLTVSDNGSGIAAEALPRVFDTFFSTKPNRGTGLGLSITRKIVEMYGGTITVSSEQNKGTAFELTFKRFVD